MVDPDLALPLARVEELVVCVECLCAIPAALTLEHYGKRHPESHRLDGWRS